MFSVSLVRDLITVFGILQGYWKHLKEGVLSRLYDFYYRRRQSLPENSLVLARNSDGKWDVYDQESGIIHRTFDTEQEARAFGDNLNQEIEKLVQGMSDESKRIRDGIDRLLRERIAREEAMGRAVNEPKGILRRVVVKALPNLGHGLPWQPALSALRPAIKTAKGVVPGKVGETHPDIIQRQGLRADEPNRGFITPDNKPLSRKDAVKWMKQNEPEVYKKWRGIVGPDATELFSEHYRKAAGLNGRIGNAI